MRVAERKERDLADRKRRIVSAARRIAEREGWSAVTVRRLADEIEYSQPVLYSHFAGRDAIVAAVAVEGFEELAVALRAAASGSTGRLEQATKVSASYLQFASEHPALYEAMFTLPTQLRFAADDTEPELRSAFAALASVVDSSGGDVDTITETLWSALHGLAELEHTGRIRPGVEQERVTLLVRRFLGFD